ncbi:metallo-beta-lactamase, putative [Babesia ovata]|uniref:Metallo-beta-lactamase, putative n=1 Tax=Babesia ovata TaxID=189622 RepID=A0A2H6KAQ0_9APIC|nr:metallo-beta-lactamase, putative [Babesia ovata]XP_028866316.1 metallo-beta-lactamase, putative [Babesia ovata]XP_028866318.1 metallo-beta-lactamase, putative [Babesia ovata]GBE60068.1 metallo-beta-lactamase, putative [Babesia ovata]GBE60073.1 metallo-beta-lactamase, putative [Babesia ovata]GBE60075.1 metallo-beta-lactamase, putative [Babesia ovata]
MHHLPVLDSGVAVISKRCDDDAASPTTETISGDKAEVAVELARVLVSSVAACVGGVSGFGWTLNHDQLLSVLGSHVALCGVPDCAMIAHACRRCATMNIQQCVSCLTLASEAVEEMAVQRISHLLGSRHTVLDITPVLSMLCDVAVSIASDSGAAHVPLLINPRREDATSTVTEPPVLNCNGAASKLRHATAHKLHRALSLADRHLVVLDDASVLKRRMQKQIQRMVRCSRRTTSGQRVDPTLEAPVIAAQSAVLRYVARFGESDIHRKGRLHSALLNVGHG